MQAHICLKGESKGLHGSSFGIRKVVVVNTKKLGLWECPLPQAPGGFQDSTFSARTSQGWPHWATWYSARIPACWSSRLVWPFELHGLILSAECCFCPDYLYLQVLGSFPEAWNLFILELWQPIDSQPFVWALPGLHCPDCRVSSCSCQAAFLFCVKTLPQMRE